MWIPDPPTQKKLTDLALCTLDRVLIIIEAYSAEHGGNAPSYGTIARVLKDSKGNVYRYVTSLVDKGTVERKNREYWLVKNDQIPTS